MITKKQLENAAKALGFNLLGFDETIGVKFSKNFDVGYFNPLSSTTQGKADLLDLMLALKVAHIDCGDYMRAAHEVEAERREGSGRILECNVLITDGDEHAALAEAVVSVASQIWESKQ